MAKMTDEKDRPEDEDRPWTTRVEPASVGGIRYEPDEPFEIGDDEEIALRREVIVAIESNRKFRHNSQLWF